MKLNYIITNLKNKFKIPFLKKRDIYTIYFIISIIIILLFNQLSSNNLNLTNSTINLMIINLKIYDFGANVALIVGILAFFASLYNTDKNFKAMKLSTIPDKSTNLLLDLEYIFNEFELYKLENKEDEFILLIEILKYWKDHQKALKLLTPHFYKNFLKIMSSQEVINGNESIPNKNSKYILMAMKSQITNIAFGQNSTIFSFINPSLITDNINIKEKGEDINNYIEFKINKNNFEEYINNIGNNKPIGKKTKEKTMKTFKTLDKNIERLLNDLKKEIDEYN